MTSRTRGENVYNPTIQVEGNARKTPFVKHFTRTGITFSCIYSDEKQTALVAVFSDPESFDTARTVPVRLHSSCANSDILGSFDCDCRSQLVRSIDLLRAQNGVLIHLFQEGRGAGIFAKYLGMYTMQSKCMSTYGAYKELDFEVDGRDYPLAFKILNDLGIKNLSLLSNNPRKLNALEEAGFSVTWEPLIGEVTPQNFAYLFSKFSEGGHKVSSLFPEEGDYYFCKMPSVPQSFKRTWIFDGDDTLWEDNIAYMRLINAFIEHCRPYLKGTPDQEVRHLIDQVEEKTIEEYGLGAIGFSKSMEIAYGLLANKYQVPRPSELLDSVISTLRSQPEALTPDAIRVLTELEKRGDRLVLYTQGPLGIQLEKIARSNLAEHFHALCVVRHKSVETLHHLKNDLALEVGEIVVVGDSLRSDIEPALRANVKAVHFQNPNSWHIQNISELDKADFFNVTNLAEILELSV